MTDRADDKEMADRAEIVTAINGAIEGRRAESVMHALNAITATVIHQTGSSAEDDTRTTGTYLRTLINSVAVLRAGKDGRAHFANAKPYTPTKQ